MLGSNIALIETKCDKLSQKIFNIQNIELRNPIKSDNLEYQIDKFEVNMQRTMKDYDKKTDFLQREIASIKQLLQSKEEIRRLNNKKVSDEMALSESNIMNALKTMREETTMRIDNVVKSIEGNIGLVKERQNESKEQLMIAISKLKQIAEGDIIQLNKAAETYAEENKTNLTSTNRILSDEFQYIYNQVERAKEMRIENENKFIKDIQIEMNKIKSEVDYAKTERLKFEERIFESLGDTIDRIQNSVN